MLKTINLIKPLSNTNYSLNVTMVSATNANSVVSGYIQAGGKTRTSFFARVRTAEARNFADPSSWIVTGY